ILIAALRAFLPVRTVRGGSHPPERHALVVDRVVTPALRPDHRRGEGRVPEDLLGDVALAERWERLIEVEVSRARRGVFTQPLVPLGDRIDGRGTVGAAAARHRSSDRIAGALLHADPPFAHGPAV